MLSVSIGTVLWSSIAFIIVVFILAKMAWKPILASIRERENSIDDALKSAEKARKDLANLQSSNEELLKEARGERDAMLKDARSTKDKIIAEAKEKAEAEYSKILSSAKEDIRTEKLAAITELKKQVADLSIHIAEKVIRQELSADQKQKDLIDKYLEEAKLN
ncbi:MAG: F-type H+-transporting ATPase subunit b [Cryomorphaceae bacterium]|jgi:F-type H+-transporting ATPase subunit b